MNFIINLMYSQIVNPKSVCWKKANSVTKTANVWSLIWFDPKNNEKKDNKKLQGELKETFQECKFLTKVEEVDEAINSSLKPIIFISCGSKYKEIQAKVQNNKYVIAIIIFCGNVNGYKNLAIECPKIIGIHSKIGDLKDTIKTIPFICSTIPGYHTVPDIHSEPKKDISILRYCNLIWPKGNSKELLDSDLMYYFKELFLQVSTVNKNEEICKGIEESIAPLVLILNAKNYNDISGKVENYDFVIGVIILDSNAKHDRNIAENSRKVIGVTDGIVELDKLINTSLVEVAYNFLTFKRMQISLSYKGPFPTSEFIEKNFFEIGDRKLIVSNLSVHVENDVCSIFFPHGFRALKIDDYLPEKSICQIEAVAMINEKFKKDSEKIIGAIRRWQMKKNLEDLFKLFFSHELFMMINYYLKVNQPQAFELVKDFYFCAKGCISEYAKPCIAKGATLYRGSIWNGDYKDDIIKAKGHVVLFPGFFSASFIKEDSSNVSATSQCVQTEITLVEFDKEFYDSLKEFNFPDENAVLYPVNIKHGQEVFFAPFYPMKIVDVDLSVKPVKAYIQAPYYVNMANDNWIQKFNKNPSINLAWTNAYFESLCKISRSGILQELSVCMTIICIYIAKTKFMDFPEAVPKIFSAIEAGNNQKKLMIGIYLSNANFIKNITSWMIKM